MRFLSRMILVVLVLGSCLAGSVSFADAPPTEEELTGQIRAALIEPDGTLAGALAAYNADIPDRLAAAINILSLGSDPARFEETDDPYLAVVQQVRAETPLLNLTAEQIAERVQFHELDRVGFVVMSVYDRPDATGDPVDLDPAVDILVIVVNYWDMRIGTLPDDALYSMKVALHPVLFRSGIFDLSSSRACHLGAYAVPAHSVAVYIIPPESG